MDMPRFVSANEFYPDMASIRQLFIRIWVRFVSVGWRILIISALTAPIRIWLDSSAIIRIWPRFVSKPSGYGLDSSAHWRILTISTLTTPAKISKHYSNFSDPSLQLTSIIQLPLSNCPLLEVFQSSFPLKLPDSHFSSSSLTSGSYLPFPSSSTSECLSSFDFFWKIFDMDMCPCLTSFALLPILCFSDNPLKKLRENNFICLKIKLEIWLKTVFCMSSSLMIP